MSFRFSHRLFVAACSVVLLAACGNDPAEVKRLTNEPHLPVQTATDIEVVYTDSARLKVRLSAPQADEFQGQHPYTEMPKGVNVRIYDDSMHVNTSLTSKYAIRREQERIMEAKNDVIVVNARGERLNTEHLIWDGARHHIYTKARVSVTTPDKQIIADGLESDETFTNYTFNNVIAEINMNDPDADSTSTAPPATPAPTVSTPKAP